jgi:peptide/nickel transport system ATP-binding protein
VSLGLPVGKTVGVVGESGSGKTTLGRGIVGMVPVQSGQLVLGRMDYTKSKVRRSPKFKRRIQMVFQDPFSSLNPRMAVGEMVAEVLPRGEFRTRSARRQEVRRIIEMVGLPADILDRYPHQFSGGQLQRLAIGRALAVRPEVVIYDEVTSGLDVSVQAKILNLLRELQADFGLSYIFISHDLSTVRYMSDIVAVMYLGRVVEIGACDEVFDHPQHPYTKTLIASLPEVGAPRRKAPLHGDLPDPMNPPDGCRFHTRCPVGPLSRNDRQICVDKNPEMQVTESGSRAACHFPGVPLTADAKLLPLEARGLNEMLDRR